MTNIYTETRIELIPIRCPHCGCQLIIEARLPVDTMPYTMLRVFLRYSIAVCPQCGLVITLD